MFSDCRSPGPEGAVGRESARGGGQWVGELAALVVCIMFTPWKQRLLRVLPAERLQNNFSRLWSGEQSGGGHFQDVPAAPARLLPSLDSRAPSGVWAWPLAPETALDSAMDKQWLQLCLWGLPRGLRMMNNKSYCMFLSVPACNALFLQCYI